MGQLTIEQTMWDTPTFTESECVGMAADQHQGTAHAFFTPETQNGKQCNVAACAAKIALQYGEVVEIGKCRLLQEPMPAPPED